MQTTNFINHKFIVGTLIGSINKEDQRIIAHEEIVVLNIN